MEEEAPGPGPNVGGAFVHSPREISARYPAAAVLAVEFNPASLVKPCGFERLIDAPRLKPTALAISIAPLPSLRRATMRARSNVAGRPLQTPLAFAASNPGALPITDKAKLNLCDHAEHGQDHPARGPGDCQRPTIAHTGSGGGNLEIGNAEG